jgi:TolB protein
MRPDGSGVRRLTAHRGEDVSPAWAPDGRRIAFASNRSGEFEIHVMRADGTGVRRLTRLARRGYGSYSPAWSPDGRTIVFSSAGPTPENPELYSVRADGTGLKRLTRTKGDAETLGDDGMPAYSPDGRTIAFTSNRTGNGELWTMRPDGSGQRRLAGLRDRDDWAPRYSPDGKLIVYESLREAASDVWVVGADGTGARLLLRNATGASYRP